LRENEGMLKPSMGFLAVAVATTFALGAVAQDAALENYKRKETDYMALQIAVERHKSLSRVGVSRNDWCSLAQAYDQFLTSLKKTIDQRRYLCGTDWCQISASDLPRFKSFQEDTAVEMRNAERRCR
jgi:hypothetical protein